MSREISRLASGILKKKKLIAWVAASLLLAIGAPFSTDYMSAATRAFYWPLMIGIAFVLGGYLRYLFSRSEQNSRRPMRWAVIGVLFALIYTPLIWLVTDVILRLSDISLREMLSLYPDILAFSVTVAMVEGYFSSAAKPASEPEAEPKEQSYSQPRLFERLEDSDGLQVVRLTVNDHYVVVTLDNGRSERILMRLRDAVAELDSLEGFYTHRSHWVNRAFITSSYRKGGRDFVTVSDGEDIPVSRTYRPQLVEAGILD